MLLTYTVPVSDGGPGWPQTYTPSASVPRTGIVEVCFQSRLLRTPTHTQILLIQSWLTPWTQPMDTGSTITEME